MIIIARTASGARDLCVGHDFTDAIITSHETDRGNDYESTLTIVDKRGFEHKIIIKMDM